MITRPEENTNNNAGNEDFVSMSNNFVNFINFNKIDEIGKRTLLKLSLA